MSRSKILLASVLLIFAAPMPSQERAASPHTVWRSATPAELQAALPVRAPVEKERIETEMPSASGIIDGHGHIIAAVVLITAGYAAQGKYSHYLLAQAPLQLGTSITLAPGSYVIGWVRSSDGLLVHVYDSETGKDRGSVVARLQTPPLQVVPIRIWPPSDRSILQIGRFALPYKPLE
ncbi:hypothetical protein GOB94_04085 [Granulicella sp. 5B5]|uniref:hypothetical protein n=1 Tax=Granulicella sp. 5B5 TaxID=1617967 RepID=UPI0015F5646F|nr:hypothetical protein [Granulicella sp. 5B5]QMV17961.1 hypothetical protein GOB94_04085 [Granulicella sp. 5B5]